MKVSCSLVPTQCSLSTVVAVCLIVSYSTIVSVVGAPGRNNRGRNRGGASEHPTGHQTGPRTLPNIQLGGGATGTEGAEDRSKPSVEEPRQDFAAMTRIGASASSSLALDVAKGDRMNQPLLVNHTGGEVPTLMPAGSKELGGAHQRSLDQPDQK